ncbi:Sodium channel protein type 4 subunit alpha B [Symbiodinium microadriaticum]|uniref:Sodium channel protein type 4 subunit alpha B n=1 Tax=Symbiodinium microadriaticum TaxID=2951 RepID=A0A1Q9D2K1_SYMMI|nr:Sodium channel protein type 4 subunit alpha B [Symbiodinium microadriaticum]
MASMVPFLRCRPGVCYHIFSAQRAALLDAHRPPEMLRSALDDVCLHAQLVLTRQGREDVSVEDFLRGAPDPPEERSVGNAQQLLREIGALTAVTAANEEEEVLEAPRYGLTAGGPITWQPRRLSNELLLCWAVWTLRVAGRGLTKGSELRRLRLHEVTTTAEPAEETEPQLAKMVLWANLLGVGGAALAVVGGLQYREPFVSLGDAQRSLSLAQANKAVRAAKLALSAPEREISKTRSAGTVNGKRVSQWSGMELGEFAWNPRKFEKDPFISVIVMVNIVFIVLQTNLSGLGREPDQAIEWIIFAMLVIYTLEALLRLYVLRLDYFCSAWNLMDFAVLIADWTLQIITFMTVEEVPRATLLRTLRVLRALRVLRTIRTLQLFRELYIMLYGFFSALKAIAWAAVLILLILLIWGIMAVELRRNDAQLFNGARGR